MSEQQKGLTHLYKIMNGELPSPSQYNYDDEASFITELPQLEYVNVSDFEQDIYTNQMRMRAKIRYLAALFPEADMNSLTTRIHGLLNNSNLELSKLRLIVNGKKLSNPQQDTNEVRIKIIQGIGKCLKDGMSLKATAREMNVSYDTVEAIERYLGIHKAYRLKQSDRAVDAARDSLSIRAFAIKENISRTLARRLLAQGYTILKELGEVK
jgi:hypothetical protein